MHSSIHAPFLLSVSVHPVVTCSIAVEGQSSSTRMKVRRIECATSQDETKRKGRRGGEELRNRKKKRKHAGRRDTEIGEKEGRKKKSCRPW
mmetsp:Transcript_30065/g.59028  ORF Transcript_30065/g.59028 Transcript_30065/m.59028 type:complete len:91 (+) Transcript_30065:2887-3159(+)